MAGRYLSSIDLGWDVRDVPSQTEIGATSQDRKLGWELELACRASIAPLRVLAKTTFRARKHAFGSPSITNVVFFLTLSPQDKIQISANTLSVDVKRNPMELLEHTASRQHAGEFCLGIIEDGVKQLADFPGFPTPLFKGLCDQFRSMKYCVTIIAGSRLLPGTKIKGTVLMEVSCLNTKRVLVGTYKNKEVFRTDLSEMGGGDVQFSTYFGGFERDGACITVKGGRPAPPDYKTRIPPAASVDLSAFPNVMELMTDKNWVEFSQ